MERFKRSIDEMMKMECVDSVTIDENTVTITIKKIPIPIEPVVGGIYALSDRIIRWKSAHIVSGANVYTQKVYSLGGGFYRNTESVGYNRDIIFMKAASESQKKELIVEEMKNGFFWELEKEN